MNRSWPFLVAITVLSATWIGCGRDRRDPATAAPPATPGRTPTTRAAPPVVPPPPPRPSLLALAPGEAYVYEDGSPAARKVSLASLATAAAAGQPGQRETTRQVVDLSDNWAPFIFQDSGGTPGTPAGQTDGKLTGKVVDKTVGKPGGDISRPNAYRHTFIELANDRVNADGRPLDAARGEHNYLEPFGIPPTLSVLRARVDEELAPERQACHARMDVEGLRAFSGSPPVSYLDRERARREHVEASRDSEWLKTIDEHDPKTKARAERAVRGQQRIRAVAALQARLSCEGLLSPRSRFTSGMFDLPTHEALAEWERKNDIFGWASLGGETLTALLRPPLELHFETLRRILAERVADAAGIVEDGSTAKWKEPPTYRDVSANTAGGPPDGGALRPVPNLINDHVEALLASIQVRTPSDMVGFLRQHPPDGWATLRVAYFPPAAPPYYTPQMELSVEIDRGDVWYDFPFDPQGHLMEQPRENYPHLTLFVHWNGQKIPLCSWRTTVGSWRSELHANGKVYYKYKNSDVGPRLWKNIVAGPVWIPPDATPAKDLLRRKVLDINKGPELVVNTEVMGPGFQSAYGLVMAIHIERSGFDNQIRTHGSVDYTSIARRFSHGCHRLVNNRAVRMFDFVLRRQPFRRIGSVPLAIKRNLRVDGKSYPFELKTRGYYYELSRPIAVTVKEGTIKGKVKSPILAYMRKAGVNYGGVQLGDRIGEGVDGARLAAPPGQPFTSPPPSSELSEPPSTGDGAGTQTGEAPDDRGPVPSPPTVPPLVEGGEEGVAADVVAPPAVPVHPAAAAAGQPSDPRVAPPEQ